MLVIFPEEPMLLVHMPEGVHRLTQIGHEIQVGHCLSGKLTHPRMTRLAASTPSGVRLFGGKGHSRLYSQYDVMDRISSE